MRPVFVSQPNWVLPRQRKGLDNFRNLLQIIGLEPRTVGVTDSPSLAPLDEVIQLMDKCFGAVVLGFPQIEVGSGSLKGEDIEAPFSLGTEWNHIEAALAYARKLPLLVIHDNTVIRGIFDPGVANVFSHSADFSSETWFLESNISGAVKTWSGRLKQT